MNEAIAKAGTLLSVESGEYSDYPVVGFFVVLRDFQPLSQLATYLAAHPEQTIAYNFNGGAFFAGLILQGLLLDISHGVLHLGNYGRSSEFRFTPVSPGD